MRIFDLCLSLMTQKIAIIGAGISGAVLANQLTKAGFKIKLFEKARGPGGRTATRKITSDAKTYHIDHGAQFIDVLDPEFKNFIDTLVSKYIVEKFDLIGADNVFVPVPNMNSLCKFLLSELNPEDLNYQVEIGAVKRNLQTENGAQEWAGDVDRADANLRANKTQSMTVFDKNGISLGDFDWVISTAPPKQSYQLFSGVKNYDFLNTIKMKAFFAVMLVSALDYDFDFVEKSFQGSQALAWLGVNSKKPQRDKTLSLIMHTNPEWTENNLDLAHDELIKIVMSELQALTGFHDANPIYLGAHRWLYGRCINPFGQDFFVDQDNHLALCGDYFLGDNIESAFLSAKRLADWLTL